MERILAIDIGGTQFRLAVFENERMVRRQSWQTNREGGREWMVAQLREKISQWLAEIPVDGIGIGFGGPVIFQKQRIAQSTHVGGWSDFPLTSVIEDAFRLPAVMDNDANVGALGEWTYGAGRNCDPFFYITISTGIGGGLIVGGELLRGADDFAGEVGHITVDPSGPECLCGAHGCLERLCSGLWLERDYGRPPAELLLDREFVQRYVKLLGLGLKAVIMLVNPARIVIGGGISRAGERLLVPLQQEMGRLITSWSRARVDIKLADLGDDSVLWGALALAKKYLKQHERVFPSKLTERARNDDNC